jgi:hypothetical protein
MTKHLTPTDVSGMRRETKTAASRIARPDWSLLFKRDPIEAAKATS